MQTDRMAAARAANVEKNTAKNATYDRQMTFKQAQMLKAVSEDAPSKLRLFGRVYSGKCSMREAVKAHCLECMGFDIAAIRECTSSQCGLWGKRPYQKG
jgi:hypothetical protein